MTLFEFIKSAFYLLGGTALLVTTALTWIIVGTYFQIYSSKKNRK